MPRGNVARVFVKHMVGLGGEQETVEDGPNQLAGKQDISVSRSSRQGFGDRFLRGQQLLPRSAPRLPQLEICTAAAPTTSQWTKVGYTWGAYAELNQRHWAIRAGYFLLPTSSNQNHSTPIIPRAGHTSPNLNCAIRCGRSPGKLRLLAYVNPRHCRRLRRCGRIASRQRELSGHHADRACSQQPGRRHQHRAGRQPAARRIFRASIGGGQTEKLGWTDVDASVSIGAVLKGDAWGRPKDRIGVGGVIDACRPRRAAISPQADLAS